MSVFSLISDRQTYPISEKSKSPTIETLIDLSIRSPRNFPDSPVIVAFVLCKVRTRTQINEIQQSEIEKCDVDKILYLASAPGHSPECEYRWRGQHAHNEAIQSGHCCSPFHSKQSSRMEYVRIYCDCDSLLPSIFLDYTTFHWD